MNLRDRGQEMREFFNDKIDTYDQCHEKFMDTKKSLITSITGNVKKVLDLGAGTGLELIYFFEKYPNARVTVIDISEKMLADLKKRDFSEKVTYICGDFFDVDFGNDYDVVISTSALHHFSKNDKYNLYKKILESLRDNGEFINCDKVVSTEDEEIFCLNEYQENPHKYPHMDTPLTIENECKILKTVGFRDVENVAQETIADNYALIKAKK